MESSMLLCYFTYLLERNAPHVASARRWYKATIGAYLDRRLCARVSGKGWVERVHNRISSSGKDSVMELLLEKFWLRTDSRLYVIQEV